MKLLKVTSIPLTGPVSDTNFKKNLFFVDKDFWGLFLVCL